MYNFRKGGLYMDSHAIADRREGPPKASALMSVSTHVLGHIKWVTSRVLCGHCVSREVQCVSLATTAANLPWNILTLGCHSIG